MWAYCHRKGAKINTNMHIENFHYQIKHIYLEGKACKRIDKCCAKLKDYINDKKFERLIKSHKGKITPKHTESFKNHKLAQSVSGVCLQTSENVWDVKSFTVPSLTYTVKKNHNCTSKCNIICRQCMCCLSAFECSLP